jgi:hypothetical protein
MGHKAEKASNASERDAVDSFQAGGVRRQNGDWVRCCPNCFSTNIVPSRVAGATWVAGIVDQGAWQCRDCGYSGATIEANRADLTKLLRGRRAQVSPERKKASYRDNRKPSHRETGL